MTENSAGNEQTEHRWFRIQTTLGQRTGVFAVRACTDSQASSVFTTWASREKNSFTLGDTFDLHLEQEDVVITHLPPEEQHNFEVTRRCYVINDEHHPFPEIFDVIVLKWQILRSERAEEVTYETEE